MDEIIVLDKNTESVKYLCEKDKRLSKVIDMVGPITYKVHADSYAFLVHEIIEQMLSIKVGAVIYDHLQTLSVSMQRMTSSKEAVLLLQSTLINAISMVDLLKFSISKS